MSPGCAAFILGDEIHVADFGRIIDIGNVGGHGTAE